MLFSLPMNMPICTPWCAVPSCTELLAISVRSVKISKFHINTLHCVAFASVFTVPRGHTDKILLFYDKKLYALQMESVLGRV